MDKKNIKTLDPSKGGIGIKLKTAKPMFIIMKYFKKLISIMTATALECEKTKTNLIILHKSMLTIANIKFEAGPAKLTNAMSRLGLENLLMLTGTGFAQPYPNKRRNTKPIKSKCFMKFSVSRPCF